MKKIIITLVAITLISLLAISLCACQEKAPKTLAEEMTDAVKQCEKIVCVGEIKDGETTVYKYSNTAEIFGESVMITTVESKIGNNFTLTDEEVVKTVDLNYDLLKTFDWTDTLLKDKASADNKTTLAVSKENLPAFLKVADPKAESDGKVEITYTSGKITQVTVEFDSQSGKTTFITLTYSYKGDN